MAEMQMLVMDAAGRLGPADPATEDRQLHALAKAANLADSSAQELWLAAQQQILEIVSFYKNAAADGLTWSEMWALATKAVSSFATVLRQFALYSAADRTAVVLLAWGYLFDVVIAPIDLPGVPNFIENTVVDPMIRKLSLSVIGGVYAGVESVINRLWPAPTPPLGTEAMVADAAIMF